MKRTNLHFFMACLATAFLISGCAPKKHNHDNYPFIGEEETIIRGALYNVVTDKIINNGTIQAGNVTTSTTNGQFSAILETNEYEEIRVMSPTFLTVETAVMTSGCLYGIEYFLEPATSANVSTKKVFGVVYRRTSSGQFPYENVIVRCEGKKDTTDSSGQFRIIGINDPTPSVRFSISSCVEEIEYVTEIKDSSKLHVVLR